MKDCTDGSDESVLECISFQCDADTKFRCLYGACIDKSLECNGQNDCIDKSDELTEKCIPNIEEKQRGNCSQQQFQCLSGECIPVESACNGIPECQDKSDEVRQYLIKDFRFSTKVRHLLIKSLKIP